MNGRPWTHTDIANLIAWRAANVKLTACAKRLDRSLGAVREKCISLRITRPRSHGWGELMTRVRLYHRRGKNDTEISEIIGCSRENIRHARRRLGLGPNITHAEAGAQGGASRMANQKRRVQERQVSTP